MKPSDAEKLGLVIETINQALAAEFSLVTPFRERPLVGQRFGVLRCDAWTRLDRDRVQVEAQVWLVEGFATYAEYVAGSLSLAAWLEHSFSGLRQAVIESPQRRMFADFSLRDPVRIPFIASAKLNKAEQGAEWTLDLLAPCNLVVLIKECP